MLVPLGKNILVQPLEQKQGSLILPGVKPSQFKIIAIGDEVTKVKPLDIIYLDKYYGKEIEHENQKFTVIDEENILAKLD